MHRYTRNGMLKVMIPKAYRIFSAYLVVCLMLAEPAVCTASESGAFSFDILNTETVTMRFTHREGIRQYAASSLLSDEGATLSRESACIETRLDHERLIFMAEVSQSIFNGGTPENTANAQDKAWKTRLAGKEGIFSWGLSVNHMGPAYMTFSSPINGAQRSRYVFDSAIDLGPSLLSLNMQRNRNYLDGYELNPLVETNSGTIRYTYAKPGALQLTTAYSCSTMEYAQDYDDSKISHAISLGTSFARPGWSLEPSYAIKKAVEKSSVYTDEINTSVVKITGELKPVERFSFSPLFSFSNTSHSDTRARCYTSQSSLRSRLRLIPGILDISTTFAHVNNWDVDGAINYTSVCAGGQVKWSLDRFISTSMTKSASLGGHVKRIRDHAGDISANEWEACATLIIKPRPTMLGTVQTKTSAY